MPAVSRDERPITGLHVKYNAVTESQTRVTLEESNPFVSLLIEPRTRR
jgi:hypothetical protein